MTLRAQTRRDPLDPGLEPKRPLRRWRWLQVNALEREHAALGDRAAWRGETTNLAAGRQHPVAWDDQRHRILGHGLSDVARSFRAGTKFIRERAVGGRASPADLPRRGVDALEERVLFTEVECEAGKIRLLARKIAFHCCDCLGHLRRGRTWL